MKKLTYPEAYDKIIQAYFKDEIIPTDSGFCFCGTLSPTGWQWNAFDHFSWGVDKEEYKSHVYDHPQPYTIGEYKRMEWALIKTNNEHLAEATDDYEDALFKGMCAALEVLKQIHKERGENVDEIPQSKFTKRTSKIKI